MMEGQQHGEQLKRGLKNRHIQLIALGGAIGTGLFLGSASVIQSAGPGIILGYAIAGFIAFLIMRQLGEMVVEEPVAGSFSHFAYKYWGSFAGFASGWNYWVLYVLVAMAELTAVGKYIQFWYPEIPTWVSAAVFFVVINAINLTNVKVFGEMEFWFAIIKVIAVVAMIIFGGWLLFSGNGGPQASVSNLWDQGGFLPHGFTGLVMMMAIIMFSFGGLELVGITAAEADNPEQSIPKATNQVIYRILIFYIGSLAVLLSLMPWTRVTADTSPFVLIFHELGDTFVANALNIVVLTAALSVYNSCVYCNSRMLFGLAQQGNAPKALASVDKRGVPVNTILVSALVTALCVLINYLAPESAFGLLMALVVSALVTALCVLINYLAPESAFGLLMALVVSALVINWAMISLAHMKFRRAKQEQGVVTRFPALLYPLGNWICLLFMAAVLVIMLMTPGMAISVYLIPVWLIVLGIGYLFKEKTAKAVKAH
ncbi:TPA: aromatic amino acid transporter AroP [Escherichia coli]|nr:aromatic amino acid transporter AroP [Escherichia coli]